MVRFSSRLTPATVIRTHLAAVATPGAIALRVALVAVASAYVLVAFADSCGGVRVASILSGATLVATAAFVALLDVALAAATAFSGRSRRLYAPVEVEAGEEGLLLRSDASEGRVSWRGYVRWRRLGDVFLLYQTGRAFIALDTSGLAEEGRERFEALVRENVGGR